MSAILKTNDGAVGSFPIQAMPLKKGFVNLETGVTITAPTLIYCVTSGTVTLTWQDDTTTDIDLFGGDSFSLNEVKSMTIGAGTKIHVSASSVA